MYMAFKFGRQMSDGYFFHNTYFISNLDISYCCLSTLHGTLGLYTVSVRNNIMYDIDI